MEKSFRIPDIAQIQQERRQIVAQFKTLKFTQKMKEVKLTCAKSCGYKLDGLKVHSTAGADSLIKMDCFNRCMNIKLESGPFIKDLGKIQQNKLPVLFLWPTGLHNSEQKPFSQNERTLF